MAKADWHYFWLRDLTVLMYGFAGTLGAIVAVMWFPVVWNTAGAAMNAGQEVPFLLLFVLPLCFVVIWALAWWAGAAKRALRMRRLLRSGVCVDAAVEDIKVYRHHGGFAAVALWLQYDLDGQTYRLKKETSWPAVVAPASDRRRIELAIDPSSPTYVALVVDGRLG